MKNEVAVGSAFALGANIVPGGVNFCVYSKNASRIDLVFFESVDAGKSARVIQLDPHWHRTYHYWHVLVPGVQPGQIYGYRAHGPFAPERGLRFDSDKVLLDPYGCTVAVSRAYDCQDNETSWFDWSLAETHAGLLPFVKLLLACRLDPARDIASHGKLTEFLESSRVHWHGVEVNQADWGPHSRSLAGTARAPRLGVYLYWAVNAYWEALEFELPSLPEGCLGPWHRWIDTALDPPNDACEWRCGPPVLTDRYCAQPRSCVILVSSESNRVSSATE
jgi:pullulanase/glycogen debranching enzyme